MALKKVRFGLTTLGMMLASCGMSSAATLTATYTVPQQIGTFTGNVNAQQFNSSLGTLTGVSVSSTANYVVTYTVTNPTGASANYTNAYGQGAVEVIGPGSLDDMLIGSTSSQAGAVAGNSSVNYPAAPATATDSYAVPAGEFANWTGNGTQTVSLQFAVDGYGAHGTGPANLQYSANGTSGGSITVTYTYTPGTPDLTILKSSTGTTFTPGQTVPFTLTPQNIGGTSSSGTITVQDTLPAGLTFTAGSFTGTNAAWTCGFAGQTATCTSSQVIGAGTNSSATQGTPIAFTALVGSTAGLLTNNTIISNGGQTNTGCGGNDCASAAITVVLPDLQLTKTASGATFSPGNSLKYTFQANNTAGAGTTGSSTITITDPIPAGTTYTSLDASSVGTWNCSAGPLASGNTVSCTNTDTMAAGATSANKLVLNFSVNSNAPAGAIPNTATVACSCTESNTNNNTANASITVVLQPDLQLTKMASGATFSPGNSLKYTFQANNTAGTATTGSSTITITDPIPAGNDVYECRRVFSWHLELFGGTAGQR